MKTIDLTNVKTDKLPISCKNYPAICNLLNEKPITNNNKKKSQVDRWSRYLVIIREGHKYHITQVRENPVEQTQKVNKRNSKYQDDGSILIMDYILDNIDSSDCWVDNNLFVINENYIFQYLGFCNSSFLMSISSRSDQRLSVKQRERFRDLCKKSMKSNLKSILNKLKKDGCIIDFNQKYFVRETKSGLRRIATEEESLQIEKHKQELLNKLDIKSEADLKKHAIRSDFYRELNKIIGANSTIESCYKNFILEVDKYFILQKYDLLDDYKRLYLRAQINKNFLTSQKTSMLKKIDKNRKTIASINENSKINRKTRFYIDFNELDNYVYPKDYFENWCYWLENFIDNSDEIEDEKVSIDEERQLC